MVKIVSVDEIKDFRIFRKWKPDPTAPQLDHVTLVHANNGSGKSTLASLLNPTTSATGWNAGVTVTIEEVAGTPRQVTSPDDPCWQNVVVFNHDYIENAVRIKDGTTNALLALGPDAVQRQRDLEKAQAELETVVADLTESQNNIARADRALHARAKAASDEISASLSHLYGRSYNAANVKREIETGLDDAARKEIDKKVLLSRACATEKKSLPSPPTTPPAPPVSVHAIRAVLTEVPVASHSEHTDLAPTTRDWLETGIALHDADDPCMFCTGTVTQERLTELQSLLTHAESSLSERARRMAQQLKTYDDTVQQWMSSLPRSNAGVYDDLGKKCTDALDTARISGEQLHLAMTNARAALTAKAEDVHATATFEIPTVGTEETNTDTKANAVQEDINSEWPTLVIEPLQAVITEHNARTAAFASEKSAAADRYKLFVLGSHREQYRAAHADLSAVQEQQRTLTEESTRLKVLIGDLSGGEFDPGPGVTWLNDELRRLLGRDELQLQVLDDRNYSITRYGAKVDHLSEGEKTALALLHFLGSLDDKGRDTQKLCVVIDDPISSLDSDIAFGVSAALWGYLLGILNCRCGNDETCRCRAGKRMRVDQLILFTHNFDFFRHWSNQLDRLPANLFNNNSGLSYVQLELRPRWRTTTGTDPHRVPEWSTFGATGRPYQRPGDDGYKERTRLRSEYHFLFHRCATALTTLHAGSPTADEQMDAESLLPNASRRLLEGFLAHRHPEKMGGKFRDSLKAGLPHDADKPTRVILDTYLNRYSHNEETTMGTTLHRPETPKMLAFVFDYLHRLDPHHFHGMCTALDLDPHQLLPTRATPYSQEELAGRTLCLDSGCPLTPWQDTNTESPLTNSA
ncbi:AAA family ATPase [Rhodococcus erythropolis]|uniref:AAA family ATPase n=1 Tax=Rhodococcus erythropolis TaxID=1833 RepID=UPI0022B4C6B3|nr:AAA family ATPase [Rhodococcus erythropolis]MCZ4570180.1 AAA family ATPase [Rhodococcus erythropolis]